MEKKKVICVGLPCYNEKENIALLCNELINEFETNLPQYDFILQIIDNGSTDGTREIVENLCEGDKRIRAIFNAKNFGADRSASHNFCNMDGDCVILMTTDFQTPISMIKRFVEEWEKGYLIVAGIKSQSKESKLMFGIRSLYYRLIDKFSNIKQIRQFTGFGLYDKSFVDFFKNFDDSFLNLRGLVAEYGYKVKYLEFVQPQRRAGKSKSNFSYLYDMAMYNFTAYTKVSVRIATLLGGVLMLASAIWFLVSIILLFVHTNVSYNYIYMLVVFLAGLQMFFIGLIGEYTVSINQKMAKRPRVLEEKRINFNYTQKEK